MQRIEGLPDNVVGIEAHGTVTAEDYENVLIPAVESVLEEHEHVRVLYVTAGDFDGYEAGAMLDDARVGLGHFFSWERIAVVTDEAWLANGVKAFAFMLPGDVRVYPTDALEEAKAWITETRTSMHVELERETGIATLEPVEAISEKDFEHAAEVLDPFIAEHGSLKGLIIRAKVFPGWDSFAAFRAHMHFIKTHYEHVDKLAFVTDSKMIGVTSSVAEHVIDIDVRVFGFDHLAAARAWILEDEA